MTDRELMSMAKKASLNAYVPYSRFPVGAAIECDDGTVSVPSGRPAAKRSVKVTAAFGGLPSTRTAKTGVLHAAHAVSFWRSFRRTWRYCVPKLATGM